MSKLGSKIIASLIGLLFFGIGANLLKQTVTVTWNGSETTGRIISISTSRGSNGDTLYAPEVEFATSDGSVHRFVSQVSSSRKPSIGSAAAIIYDPINPDKAVVKSGVSMYLLPGISIFAGLLLLFLEFLLPPLIASHHKRKAQRLRSIGRPIQAQIIKAAPTGVVVNGDPYYAITAQWLDTASNVLHVYKSFSMLYDPTQVLDGKKEVTVYVNPSNPKDYWMDTTFLPALET